MVDETRIVRLLQRVGEQLAHLERHAAEDRVALRGDDVRLSAVKYRFVTMLEAVLDVAHHLCASQAWGPPSANAEAVTTLGRHDVLDDALAQRIGAAVRFRNVLVHGYADVDDDLVVANLDRLSDVRTFIQQLSHWLATQRDGR